MIKTTWIFLLFSLFPITSFASEFIYTPVNPAFGGLPGNGIYLLNSAEAQNEHKDPNSTDPFSNDPLDNFQQTLNRLILNQIASRIVDGAFGEDNGLGEGGIFTSGDFIIEIDNSDPNNISLTITDTLTNETTILEIPTFY